MIRTIWPHWRLARIVRIDCAGPPGRPQQADARACFAPSVSALGQGQVASPPPKQGLRLSTSMVGRILSRSEAARRAGGSVRGTPCSGAAPQAAPSSVGHTKAPFLAGAEPGDLVASGYQAVAPGARRGVAPLLGARSGLSLGCAGSSPRPRARRRSLPGSSAARMPFPIRRPASRRWQRIRRRIRASLPAARLPLFVLPPRSPKLNGQVERAHRTHNEEFYEVTPERWNLRSSIANCSLGNRPTTPCALTRRSAMPPRWSSSSAVKIQTQESQKCH